MTANDLIAAFEALADAPGGVKRLRELVLQLAVRGKLVAQDPADEGAGPLLARITRGRAKVEDALRVRRPKPTTPVSGEEAPFDLPDTWAWCRLQDVGVVVAGGTPPSGDESNFCQDSGHPWLTPADMRTWTKGKYIARGERNLTDKGLRACSAQLMPAGTVVFSSRAPIGYVAIAANPLSTNQGFKSVVPGIEGLEGFLRLYLLFAAPYIDAVAPGTTFKEVSGSFMGPYPVPLPPLAEQHRIVARVDELMGLLDRLEAARTARDTVRRAARDAALAALRDAEDTDAVEAAWGRISGQMDALFAEPEDVGPLRQAVLQQAVRGRLVPQDPNDETAGELLASRKHQLSEPPWQLPAGWAWSTIALLGDVLGGGTPSKANSAYWAGHIPWVSPKDMKVPWLSDSQDHVSVAAVEGSSTKLIPAGAVLMVVRGMILAHSFPVAVTKVEVTVNQDMKVLVPYRTGLAPFLLLLLQGSRDRVLGLVEHSTHGTCKLPFAALSSLPLAIPPLAEQHRIVAKVDALMAICDAFEGRLTTGRELHAQFAAAAVHHLDV